MIGATTYSAVVIMVIVTTFVTPPLRGRWRTGKPVRGGGPKAS